MVIQTTTTLLSARQNSPELRTMMKKEVFETRSGSASTRDASQESDCENPELLLKRLIETGIFNDTAYSEIDSTYREIQHSNEQLAQPDCHEDDETMYEFITRIEGEVGSKWNDSQQLVDGSCIDNIEQWDENELLERQNDVDLSQIGDWDHNTAIHSSFYDIYPVSGQELAPANQAMPEDRGHLGYEQAQDWTGKYHDEPGVSDAEMAAFWRPNYF
ncbi:hypothetical protein FBEOM_446 [Fusarium beomiforme]|uniref:Uncharacterized protein n=1 Tax=Fusarium beomiforme TaxID=44412 RepID=A0A9P5E528_9HYPO|nr:hypothetical protein FBEOM_446 [Fusarium beomiforme]